MMPAIWIKDLTSPHRDAIRRAISNVLDTELAEFTYAQILDGLPTTDTYMDTRGGCLNIEHPLRKHTQLCDGVLKRTKEYFKAFDPDGLKIGSKLIGAFQNAEVGTREFQMRLIEMTAVAVHLIAVNIAELDVSLHKDDGVTSWMYHYDESDGGYIPPYLKEPPVTLFEHSAYKRHPYYPHGVADIIGYWAENRILGGVTLFNRGRSGFKCKDIYFHSDRDDVTFFIYKLLDSQVNTLLQFLTGSDVPSPLPILGNKTNLARVDPHYAIDRFHIYRDRWEREVPNPIPRRSCVVSSIDYPELDIQWEQCKEIIRNQIQAEREERQRGEIEDGKE